MNVHAGQISEAESQRLLKILGPIDAIRLYDPVHYAVDRKGLTRIDYQTMTTIIHVNEVIPPEKIKAKLCISSSVSYALIDVKKYKKVWA